MGWQAVGLETRLIGQIGVAALERCNCAVGQIDACQLGERVADIGEIAGIESARYRELGNGAAWNTDERLQLSCLGMTGVVDSPQAVGGKQE